MYEEVGFCPHGWILVSLPALEDAPSACHVVLSHLHCGCVGSKGYFCFCLFLNLTHFGKSWMKSTGRWLPLHDFLSSDKGVGWLVLQLEFTPKGE